MHDNDGTPDGLSEQDANDCIELVEDISGVRLTHKQLLDVLNADLIAEISEWGLEDSEVSGRVATAFSEHILERPWPQGMDQVDSDSFLADLRAGARKQGFYLVERSGNRVQSTQSASGEAPGAASQAHNLILVGESRPSLLERLTPRERGELFAWSRDQRPSSPGGTVDLMAWPGWVGALYRIEADSTAAWGAALDIIDRIKAQGAK
ncbi:hypothetical protein [Paraburkholderia sp. J8-2]|uniref:hypothetical protein n=1 Tax=Paraburkholderia sp. J8-2 TaxID=2805440 RepID=UPI002AB634A6|nr:hypothetical protein [Paraburkholderia sp. J8-2]